MTGVAKGKKPCIWVDMALDKDGNWIDGRTLRKLPPGERRRRRRAYETANRELFREAARKFAKANPGYKTQRQKIARERGIAAYGGKCSCCGEKNKGFLTIDHINGPGNDRQPSNGRRIKGLKMWEKLQARNWPKDNYQLLCFNCNCGKQANNGICPHKKGG
jgi:hypothetical protein